MSAILNSIHDLGIVSWAGHLVAVWVLGLTLGWLVSLVSLFQVAALPLRGRRNRFVGS
jgi:hypothetical protein